MTALQIQQRLASMAARLADVTQAAPRFAQATARHYQGVPIARRSGRLADGYRNPQSGDFQLEGRPDGFVYRNQTPYAGRHPVPRPPIGVYTSALREHVLGQEGR